MSYDILTTCHQCGRLIYVPYNIWDIIKSKTNPNNDLSGSQQLIQLNSHHSIPIRQKVNFISYIIKESSENSNKSTDSQLYGIQDFNCVQLFQNEKRKQTFAVSNTAYFPLCLDCTTTYKFHLCNFKKLYEKSSFFIDSKLKSIPNGVFQIQYENAITPFSKSQISSTNFVSNDSKSTNRLSIYSRPSNMTQRTVIKQHDQIKDRFLDPANLNKAVLPAHSFCPLYSFSIFKIGTNYHYGTINDLRVGFYEYSPNSALETDLALYSIAHLIYTLKSALCIDKINIILASKPSISLNIENNASNDKKDSKPKKEKKSLLKPKRKRKDTDTDNDNDNDAESSEDKSDISEDSTYIFDLVLPEINQNSLNNNKEVILSKISKKKYNHHYYSNINNAINALFISFVLIDNASSCLPKYSSPYYRVNLKERTIGNISYVFDWKNIENWTLAMRMLLFNLKKIQVIFIRSYFCR